MEWRYIDDITSLDGINILHCDTRDFHCALHSTYIDTKDAKNRAISRVFHNFTYQLKDNELLRWLKEIETMSGGKGEWRLLDFNKVHCDGWLKYIRCYRNPKNPEYFIICNGESIPIVWGLCDEEHLIKQYLNFIEDENN